MDFCKDAVASAPDLPADESETPKVKRQRCVTAFMSVQSSMVMHNAALLFTQASLVTHDSQPQPCSLVCMILVPTHDCPANASQEQLIR